MSSSDRPAGQPRAFTLNAPRVVMAFVAVVVLPATLTACGLLGGDGEEQAPVVIPGDAAADVSSSVSPTAPTRPANGTPVGANITPVNATVTTTGVIVQEKTRTRTSTQTATETATVMATAIVSLPQVTVTRTPAPVTQTETRTETRTETTTKSGAQTTITVTVTKGLVP